MGTFPYDFFWRHIIDFPTIFSSPCLSGRKQAHTDDADENAEQADALQKAQMLTEHEDADEYGADGADASPDSISRAERQVLHRLGKQNEAQY